MATGPRSGAGVPARQARVAQLRARTRLLTDTRAEILRLLELAGNSVRYRLGLDPSMAERESLAGLQREIVRVMGEFGQDASARLGAAAGSAWRLGADLIDKTLDAGAIRIDGLVPVLDTRQLEAMRAFMTERIADVGTQAANKINTRLGLAMIGAQGFSDTVTAIDAVLGGESRDRAITITRTELSRVYAVAAQERAAQAAAVVPGLKKQWRRSGKLHSRINHDLIDGQVVDVEQPFQLTDAAGRPLAMMYPHDPKAPVGEVINCGCTAIPWKADWEVGTPGRRRFSEREIAADPVKGELQAAIDAGRPLADVFRRGKAA